MSPTQGDARLNLHQRFVHEAAHEYRGEHVDDLRRKVQAASQFKEHCIRAIIFLREEEGDQRHCACDRRADQTKRMRYSARGWSPLCGVLIEKSVTNKKAAHSVG